MVILLMNDSSLSLKEPLSLQIHCHLHNSPSLMHSCSRDLTPLRNYEVIILAFTGVVADISLFVVPFAALSQHTQLMSTSVRN